jgi:hypothetical protein
MNRMATSTGQQTAKNVVVSSQMAKDEPIEALGHTEPSSAPRKLFGNQLQWAKGVIAETRAQRRSS